MDGLKHLTPVGLLNLFSEVRAETVSRLMRHGKAYVSLDTPVRVRNILHCKEVEVVGIRMDWKDDSLTEGHIVFVGGSREGPTDPWALDARDTTTPDLIRLLQAFDFKNPA